MTKTEQKQEAKLEATYASKIKGQLFAHPEQLLTNRCRRRYLDAVFAFNDAANPNSVLRLAGVTEKEAKDVAKERFWLLLRCVGSMPGQEPAKTPFLYRPYPQL